MAPPPPDARAQPDLLVSAAGLPDRAPRRGHAGRRARRRLAARSRVPDPHGDRRLPAARGRQPADRLWSVRQGVRDQSPRGSRSVARASSAPVPSRARAAHGRRADVRRPRARRRGDRAVAREWSRKPRPGARDDRCGDARDRRRPGLLHVVLALDPQPPPARALTIATARANRRAILKMTSPRSAAATPDTAGTFPALPAAAIGLICAVVAAAATVGADARWLAALGHAIVASRSIPDGVPYASAPSGAWPNVPVLAELVLHALVAAFGDHGLLLAQVIAVAGALSLLAVDMRRRGAKDGASALVLSLIAIGGASSFFVIRVQLFSLVLFPALVLLLRAEARSPSRRVWLIPLLIALWSNLHGAVLVGLAVAAAYLVFDRARQEPLTATAVLVASALAVCATPALERTPIYYS